jgi:hypothetical protein
MNSHLKKFQAIGLALLLLLQSILTAAQTPVTRVRKVLTKYGLESEMRIPSEIMRRTATGLTPGTSVRQILKSLLIFSEAGGIMFDAVGQPCTGLAKAQLRLSYNRKQPDGQRLTLHVGKRAYPIVGISDDDLQPIAKFANSSIPVLTNLQYPDAPIRSACGLPSSSLRIVTLHPAFLNTHLGRLLTSMDFIPWSFSKGERWDSDSPLPDATLSLADSLGSALRADKAEYSKMWPTMRSGFINNGVSLLKGLRKEYREHYASLAKERSDADWKSYETVALAEPGINKSVWQKLGVDDRRILLTLIDSLRDDRVSNINDDDAAPSFCTQASTVRLDGSPNLQFIAPWHEETYTFPKSSSLMTENIPQLRLVDQEAYDGMMKIYRLGGLFRYVKQQQSPFLWKQFLRSLPPVKNKDTYTIVCPDCEKEELEEWLTCVDSEFPSAS